MTDPFGLFNDPVSRRILGSRTKAEADAILLEARAVLEQESNQRFLAMLATEEEKHVKRMAEIDASSLPADLKVELKEALKWAHQNFLKKLHKIHHS